MSRVAMSSAERMTQLLGGLEKSIRERGYAATTVADIVAAAGVSKRTFYENFDSKGECLLEHHRRFHATVADEISREAARASSSQEATVVGVEIYFRMFVTQPHIARAHLLDVLTVGDEGLKARRDAAWGYVRKMQHVMGTARDDRPAKLLDDVSGLGILGGINELALETVLRDDPSTVDEAVRQAVVFVRAVIRDLPDLEGDPPGGPV
ncbi:TetR/AcrR family transcriptional regulator [Aeromicrobium sp. CF4.19]|uniref:TetR/AcrR family transcriptional regulator n=1 Tax=Aeromicrobium sp. CF4.19 TaxID=3373082 RepID=UPI003EE501E0